MKKIKEGISLIVLVITIIVMIILAAAIIISLKNTGIIGEANKATIKQNLNNYKTELNLKIAEKIAENPNYEMGPYEITNTTTPSILDLIPDMSKEDAKCFKVVQGNLVYMVESREKYEACKELGIWIDATNLTEAEYKEIFKEEIAYFDSISDTDRPLTGERDGWYIKDGVTLNTDIVVVPYGVTDIGLVAIPDGVKTVIMPNTIKEISSWAFLSSSLEYLFIPEGTYVLHDTCFMYSKNLKYVKLPESLEILDGSFHGCESLEYVVIPKSVKSINDGTGPFEGCKKLKDIIVDKDSPYYISENGVLFNKSKYTWNGKNCENEKECIIAVVPTKTGKYIVPDTVKVIGCHAFSTTKISSIVISANVTKIESTAFQNVNNLKEIYIESTNITMDNYAFKYLPKGSTIYVRNKEVADMLDGKYNADNTTVSTNYNW